MSRNLTFAYALVVILGVWGGFPDPVRGDEKDDEIKALRAAVNRLQKALLGEQAARARSAERANQLSRELTGELDQAEVVIRRLENMSKQYALQIKELQAEKTAGPDGLERGAAVKSDSPPAVTTTGRVVSGKVIAVSGGVASVNVGLAKGVKKKMVLRVFRGSKFVANLRVDLVRPDSAAGVILDKKLDVLVGDLVATSPGKPTRGSGDKGARDVTKRMGFAYGGAPKIDKPPLGRDAKEKKALAALGEMAKGKWYLNITTREGRVLRQLVEASGAKCVVEVGTSSGYSTIWLALGARATGGRVITHEINPKMIALARANFKKAGVDDIITIVKGDAHETIKQLKGPIGVVFLDAEKKGYVDYLAKLLPLVRPGGLILGHDMRLPKPDPRYIKAITTNPKLDTSFIMMEGFGISLTVKKR